jgi:hypothetical protein
LLTQGRTIYRHDCIDESDSGGMDNLLLVEIEHMKEGGVNSTLQAKEKACSKYLEENKEWFNPLSCL